ncbi:MAG TPA: alpha/beta hydrolase, partial [Pirellulales bacterium]|nr:alpha/beta hydrolase [Pirellulales bacterium]
MSAFVSILARQRVARRMLSGTVRVAVIMAGFSAAAADDAPAKPQTFVYKTVGPTKIELDVYPPSGSEPRPGVVWIHGGALIMGSRHGVPGDIARLCRERNYVLVSIDYRLAPEVKLPAIIEDLRDA